MSKEYKVRKVKVTTTDDSFFALYDDARLLLFTTAYTMEIAKKLGWEIEEINEDCKSEHCQNEVMIFPKTFDEFEKQYAFTDESKIYTNGSRLIPVFRVEQWLEHIKEIKE